MIIWDVKIYRVELMNLLNRIMECRKKGRICNEEVFLKNILKNHNKSINKYEIPMYILINHQMNEISIWCNDEQRKELSLPIYMIQCVQTILCSTIQINVKISKYLYLCF